MTKNIGPYNGNFFPNMENEKKKEDKALIYNDKIEILKQVLKILENL